MPKPDDTEYHFIHKSGEQRHCTVRALIREFGLSLHMHAVARGEQGSHKGWYVAGRATERRFRVTYEDAIARAVAAHESDHYLYDARTRVSWRSYDKPVDIWCNVHQEYFAQPFKDHANGHGCPKCGYDRNRGNAYYELFGKEDFDAALTEATKRHPEQGAGANPINHNRYRFDASSRTAWEQWQGNGRWTAAKIPIWCSFHREYFVLTLARYAEGCGCTKCAILNAVIAKQIDTETFIHDCSMIHGGKYDYSRTNYVDMVTKVIIVCPFHGPFEQRSQSHLLGHGCTKCAGVKSPALTDDEQRRFDALVKTLKSALRKVVD